MIRLARPDELPALAGIEREAGALFGSVGMTAVAEDEPPSQAELSAFQRAGRAWVAVDERDAPVAYVLVEVVDGAAHIEQLSVHPAHARQGLGRRLLETVSTWAGDHGLRALTLTTFADVPWNAPYYRRLGFRVLREAELTAGLRRVREHEAAHGLDAWPRVVMRRGVDPKAP